MATNFYFDHHYNGTEQNLIEDLTIETIKLHGIDMVYIPRGSESRDEILGEDELARYAEKYLIEMYLETVDGFTGDGDLMAKFGFQIKDSADFVLSKRRFKEVIPTLDRPREGDLVYLPLSKGLFEINFVDHENPFYNLGKLHTYKLTVELFTYNNEEFDTGLTDIDRIETDNSNEEILKINDNADIQEESVESVIDYSESNPFGEW